MTTREFAEAAGVSPVTVRHLLECGLLLTSNGRLIGDGQVERARLIQQVLRKGVTLAQLAAANLSLDAGQKYLVFDGRRLRGYADALSAFAPGGAVSHPVSNPLHSSPVSAIRHQSDADHLTGDCLQSDR